MPTFLIFKNASVTDTIRGADANSLRSAVSKAASDAARGPAKTSTAFQSKGHVLGSGGGNAATSNTYMPSFNLSGVTPRLSGQGFLDSVVRFLGLYVTSLFSFDSLAAAERSPFAVQNTGRR